jgi:hypothetical protein
VQPGGAVVSRVVQLSRNMEKGGENRAVFYSFTETARTWGTFLKQLHHCTTFPNSLIILLG